ncbi:GNAT family N-acetyltransferase [soil metagenome]
MPFSLRKMCLADIDAVYAVQAAAYVDDMVEALSLLQARWLSAPDTAWVAYDTQGVCAYLVAYPSLHGKITALGSRFVVPEQPDCLYLHDLAVAPRAHGQQLGSRLVRQALQHAASARYPYSALVAVQNSQAFWKKCGYTEHQTVSQDQLSCLRSYAGDATYFVNTL